MSPDSGSDGATPAATQAATQGAVVSPGDEQDVAVTTSEPSDRRVDEQTWQELKQIAARYPQQRSGLLPMLHLVQSAEGRITPAGIEACATILQITAAEVSGVATFYTMYKRRPVGDYHVGVCTNTLCAIMGGDVILDRLKEHLDVGNDETAEVRPGDGASVSLEHIECNAACDYAPVMTVNWEFMDNMTPDSAVRLVDDLRAGTEVRSTRGARLCTWREAERVLAGFPDGRADEGPAAGPPSLVGLAIARERGWTAPGTDASGRTGPEAEAPGSHEAIEKADDQAVAASPADRKHEDDTRPGGEEAR